METKFRYKAWANAEMLDALAQIDEKQYPEQWKLAVRLMNHTYVVDRIFAAHLTGTTHAYQGTNTPETPTVAQLRDSICASDAWYQRYVAQLDDAALRETLVFTFTDGDPGAMTREELTAAITGATWAWCYRRAGSNVPRTRSPAFCTRLSKVGARRFAVEQLNS